MDSGSFKRGLELDGYFYKLGCPFCVCVLSTVGRLMFGSSHVGGAPDLPKALNLAAELVTVYPLGCVYIYITIQKWIEPGVYPECFTVLSKIVSYVLQ